MPMADFYSTVPMPGEGPVEYWLRLNKAVDAAEEGLKRLGRNMTDPCHEAAMMFVKYCPDATLAAVFRFKAPDKWTASEVQEHIDRFQTERKELTVVKPKRSQPVTVHVQTPEPSPPETACHVAESVKQSESSKSCNDECLKMLVSLFDRALSQNNHAVSDAIKPDHFQRRSCRVSEHPVVKLAGPHWERGYVGSEETLNGELQQHYAKACTTAPFGAKVIMQNTQRVTPYDELFYTPVKVNNTLEVKGMLDSGSMACTLSEKAESEMLKKMVLPDPVPLNREIVLVGCGGTLSKPKCMYEVEMKLYGQNCIVPVLVVPGQRDDLIIGTNVIRFLMGQLKVTSDYVRLVSSDSLSPECEQFLDLMANSTLWQGDELPDKIGTVKLQQSVTLLARQEHLVWGKLPKNVPMSPGSTVIVEPTTSKSMPRNILVGRIVTPLWGDRWVPMKVTNLSDKPITLKKNAKLADVSSCVAVEEFEISQGSCQPEKHTQQEGSNSCPSDLKEKLKRVGLSEIDIDQCHASQSDFTQPLILSIDASLDGLGAVLSQVPEGEKKARPIAFASKTLTNSQKKYPAHRLEFLALKWSVCEKFSHWLRGNLFTVWTDNNPLTYIMTKPKLDACEQRWVSKLAPYTFDLKHIPGTKNVVADALSRDPFAKTVSQRLITERYDQLVAEAEGVAPDSVQDTFRLKVLSHRVKRTSILKFSPTSNADIGALLDTHCEWENAAETRAVQFIQAVQDMVPPGQDPLPVFTLAELQHSQENDPTISALVPFVSRKRRPSRRERVTFDSKAMVLSKQFERLKLQNGVLYRSQKTLSVKLEGISLYSPKA
ncbi:hypothetical protein WMY93_032421 [Mugilogobius chulae]|uniref:Reverse transcriptase RNase H-like domain-containing protein n=1 Tax=Mugilogobius chulae TaxID=88201 RepID=A0AAW0MVR1_9GOBI